MVGLFTMDPRLIVHRSNTFVIWVSFTHFVFNHEWLHVTFNSEKFCLRYRWLSFAKVCIKCLIYFSLSYLLLELDLIASVTLSWAGIIKKYSKGHKYWNRWELSQRERSKLKSNEITHTNVSHRHKAVITLRIRSCGYTWTQLVSDWINRNKYARTVCLPYMSIIFVFDSLLWNATTL